MVLVLGLAAMIWGLGNAAGLPAQARFLLLGLLYIAILAIQFVFPEGAPLREAIGGSLGEWLLLGVIGAGVWLYRKGLGGLRARAAVKEAAAAPPTNPGTFSEVELDRYARHIILREIGGPGQKALKQAKVLVVGAGGLGSPALLYLAAAGVGRIGVIDADIVSVSNLQRQVIHEDDGIGMPKVFSAEAAMLALNPHIEVRPYNRNLDAEIAEELIADYDLVLDGTDSFAARQMVNAACVAARRPLIAGAITQWEGQVTVYDPAAGAPCLTCIFPNAPAPGQAPSCAEAGVVGALPGMIGAQMAGEAIKIITGAGEPLRGRMMIHDVLYGEARTMRIKRRADCACCGDV